MPLDNYEVSNEASQQEDIYFFKENSQGLDDANAPQ
jgi:hypothetical protein